MRRRNARHLGVASIVPRRRMSLRGRDGGSRRRGPQASPSHRESRGRSSHQDQIHPRVCSHTRSASIPARRDARVALFMADLVWWYYEVGASAMETRRQTASDARRRRSVPNEITGGRASRNDVPNVSRRRARPVRVHDLALLLDEVLGARGRYAWYEALGDLRLLSHVPRPLVTEWADLAALDRALSLCAYLVDCHLPLRDVPGTRYYATLPDPTPATYGALARILRDNIEGLTVAREARTPPPVRRKPRTRARPGKSPRAEKSR